MWIQNFPAPHSSSRPEFSIVKKSWNSRENLFSICHHSASVIAKMLSSSSHSPLCKRMKCYLIENTHTWKFIIVFWGRCGEENIRISIKERNEIFTCNRKSRKVKKFEGLRSSFLTKWWHARNGECASHFEHAKSRQNHYNLQLFLVACCEYFSLFHLSTFIVS